MRVEQLDTLAARAGQGLSLGLLHGVQQGVEQVERHYHQDVRQRIGALQFPGDAGGVPRDFLGARLRVNAVRLDVPLEADMADGVGVRVGVFQVRALAGVGIDENDFRSDLEAVRMASVNGSAGSMGT